MKKIGDLHHVDLIAKTQQAKARLKDTDVGFATGHDNLLPLQAPEAVPYLLLLAQVEEIFLECL
jgi:hypothetical protein